VRLSQKTYYALRSVLELAKHPGSDPVSIAAIAASQQIPPQFLQVIMRELRQGGFVDSRRGKEGGYLLARKPSDIPVGEVVRFLEGDFTPVDDQDHGSGEDFPAFTQLWQDARTALDHVFDTTSFADLIDRERAASAAGDYVI
jgi:Rrf2 family cysteine metabolism transcriptional repressor